MSFYLFLSLFSLLWLSLSFLFVLSSILPIFGFRCHCISFFSLFFLSLSCVYVPPRCFLNSFRHWYSLFLLSFFSNIFPSLITPVFLPLFLVHFRCL